MDHIGMDVHKKESHVHGVGEQRRGGSGRPRDELREEHGSVDPEHELKDTPLLIGNGAHFTTRASMLTILPENGPIRLKALTPSIGPDFMLRAAAS